MVKIVSFLLFLLNDFIIIFFQHIHPLEKHLLKSKKQIVITLRNTAYIFSFEVYRLINMWGE